MAIVSRVQLGSSVRRVKPPKPIPGVDPVIAYEHIYHELIYVVPGGPDQGLPPETPGVPEVGVPSFPDNALPDAPGIPDNSLPALPVGGWPGCPGHEVDNSLPVPPASVDNTLPEAPPEVWGGAPATPDNTLPDPEAQPK